MKSESIDWDCVAKVLSRMDLTGFVLLVLFSPIFLLLWLYSKFIERRWLKMELNRGQLESLKELLN